MLWFDVNGDGISQARELSTLEDMGVVSIGLEMFGSADLDQSITENQIIGHSDVLLADGSVRSAFDVALYFESSGDACGCHGMPNMGYGNGPDMIFLQDVPV